MLSAIRKTHRWTDRAVEIARNWLLSDEGLLAIISVGRFLALMAIITFFNGRHAAAPNQTLLKGLLLFFWAYVIAAGVAGVYRKEWMRRPFTKRLQVALEIALTSIFLYLTQDPDSAIYFIYFLPLAVAAEYLSFRWASFMLALSLAGCWLARALMPQPLAFSLFWPQAVFMVAISALFMLHANRRRSVLEEVQTETSEVMRVLKQHDDGVYVIDGLKRLRFVNQVLQDTHGPLRPGELCYNYFDCAPESCGWDLVDDSSSCFGQSIRGEGVFRDLSGTPYQVENIYFPLAAGDDQSQGAIGFVRNVEHFKNMASNLDNMSRQQARWRQAYEAMGRRISGFDSLDNLMQILVDETMYHLGAETSALFEREGDLLVRRAIAGVESDWFTEESYHIGEGITGRAAEAVAGAKYAKPELANDVDTNPITMPHPLEQYTRKLASGRVKHLIAVPLNSRIGTFGVLRVVNRITTPGQLAEDGFTQQDVDFLLTLASMVALAIENTRLLEEAGQRVQEMTTLYEVNQRITQTLDLDELLLNIVDAADRITTGKKVIQLVDERNHTLIPQLGHGRQGDPLKMDEGIAGRAIRTRQPQYVPDTSIDPDFVNRGEPDLHALLVIPLLAGKRVLGLLSVNGDRKDAFSKDQHRGLRSLATQAAIALEKAQLYRRTRALLQVTNTLNTSSDLQLNLHRALSELQEVVAFNSISVQELHDNELRIIYAWGFDDNSAVEQLRFPATAVKFPNFEVLHSKTPVRVADVRQTYPHFEIEAKRYHSQDVRSWLGVPVIREDTSVGMIAIDHHQPDFFTQMDAHIALTFANHLATAMDNATRYKAETKQANMLEQLVTAEQKLIEHSTLDELYNYCAVEGARIFQVEDCSLTVIDSQHEILELVSSTCLPDDIRAASTTPLDAPGLRCHVFRTGETLNFGGDSYKLHPAWSGQHTEHFQYLPSRCSHSLLMGPLRDGDGNIVGVLRMENRLEPMIGTPFSQFEEQLHQMFAASIGTAIERVRFFQRIDEEARAKARRNLSQDLHDSNSLLHALVLSTSVGTQLLQKKRTAELADRLDLIHKAARHLKANLLLIEEDSREPMLQEKGLLPALKHYSEMLPLPPIHTTGDHHTLPPETAHGLYRIGQQALSNIARHAGEVHDVQIDLQLSGNAYSMIVRDDGRGFDINSKKDREDSFGLIGMFHKAEQIHAKLEFQSQPRSGTAVIVSGTIVEGEER